LKAWRSDPRPAEYTTLPSRADIREWCDSARPIFIVGLARSGTSMLQVAFAQHPTMFDIANCRETFIFLRPRQPFSDPIHFPTRAYLRGRDNLLAFRTLVDVLERDGGPLSESDLVRAFFWYAGNKVYPGRNPLEKTPGHLRKLDLIFETFPRTKVLVCSRDPVEVMASYRKRLLKAQAEGDPPEKTAWLDKSADEMIAVFRNFTEMVHSASEKYGRDMFMAPYAWLIDDPEASIRRLCDFVGMRFNPRMVASDEKIEQEGGGEKAHAIQRRASDADKVLTPAEIAQIQAATAPWIEEWSTPGVIGH